jgi:hypothetical protein
MPSPMGKPIEYRHNRVVGEQQPGGCAIFPVAILKVVQTRQLRQSRPVRSVEPLDPRPPMVGRSSATLAK